MASLAARQQTLASLEERLQRLQFLLHGDIDASNTATAEGPKIPVAARLEKLERSMQDLRTQSSAVSQLLNLQTQFPLLFTDSPLERPIQSPDDSALSSLVLSHAPSYHSTAARLTSLNDLPIPDASLSADLMCHLPRLERMSERGFKQESEMAELRYRSAAVIERWYELGVVGMGECWNEWESRLTTSERTIRREQARRNRDNGDI